MRGKLHAGSVGADRTPQEKRAATYVTAVVDADDDAADDDEDADCGGCDGAGAGVGTVACSGGGARKEHVVIST